MALSCTPRGVRARAEYVVRVPHTHHRVPREFARRYLCVRYEIGAPLRIFGMLSYCSLTHSVWLPGVSSGLVSGPVCCRNAAVMTNIAGLVGSVCRTALAGNAPDEYFRPACEVNGQWLDGIRCHEYPCTPSSGG